MIASLTGPVIAIELSGAVIECAGVGYFFIATPATLATLRRGEVATVLTTMVVREDALTLYGFIDPAARAMFGVLQTVSGLGPRLALAAESVYSAAELAGFISSSDARALQRIPGVGKRMAERMIVDLKDKVQGYVDEAGDATDEPAAAPGAATESAVGIQVTAALVGLGFTEKQAAGAVDAVLAEADTLDTSSALRAALARLGQKG